MPQLIAILPLAGLTLAWIVPLHLLPWVSWHNEVPVFAAVFLTALWAVVAQVRGSSGQKLLALPGFALALVGLAALVVLQAASGLIRFWGDAWVIILYLGLALSSFLVGRAAADTREGGAEYADRLAMTLVVAGVGCSIIALAQTLEVWLSSEWIARTENRLRPGSNLAQANQMGTLVLLGLVSLCYLHERCRLGGGVAWLLAGVLAIGLSSTASRTALVSFGALVLWWAFWRAQRRLRATAIVMMALALAIGYIAWPHAIMLFHGAQEPAASHITQAGMRAVVWPQLLEAVLQRPWLGWGLRQVPAALTSVLDQQPVSDAFSYAHNVIIDLMLGVGVLVTGFLLFAALIWAGNRIKAAGATVAWFCMALAIPFIVHSMLEFPHAYAYLLAPVLFALGVVDAAVRTQTVVRIPIAAAAVGLMAVAALGAWSLIEYIGIEEDFRIARFEAARIGEPPAGYERPTVHVLTQLDTLLTAARVVPAPGMQPQQVRLSRDAAYRFPWPALQNRYALALALNGETGEAHRMLRVIRAMHGNSTYANIRRQWSALATERYPQLGATPLP